MLNLRIKQEVWLCTHGRQRRSAWVEELAEEAAWVRFQSNSSDLTRAQFSLKDGYNIGNRAYWIEIK